MSTTRITVSLADGRPRVRLSAGLLRAQPVHSLNGWPRIGLLATTAVLLGGDVVELEVAVGPGARLDLFDVAGTVAFHGRGRAAGWHSRITVADGASLTWAGLPFVLADGAVVTRTTELDLAPSAQALVRDTLVLGRSGETGGWLRNRTSIRVGDRLVCLEDQQLDPELRVLPGMLGSHRVVDTITSVGAAGPAEPDGPATRFTLVGGTGTLTRHLGPDLAASPLHRLWTDLTSAADGPRGAGHRQQGDPTAGRDGSPASAGRGVLARG